jgi:NAD+ kinase
MHALRFKVYISGQKTGPEVIIGDGVVVTTPFGSSGYYQSITRQTLKTGFAVAFNNTTVALKPLKFTAIQDVRIVIVRGPGSLSSDNNPKIHPLKENDEVKIFASIHKAQIFMETLRCSDCVILRDKRLR